tara:strand:+ start:397 stop:693 length:297 start_codon:yes stop_codon:yes gene_type:complete
LAIKLSIHWSEKSTNDLRTIFDFYNSKSHAAATTIVTEIIDQVESIRFSKQFQKDELNPKYRRLIVRHFKVLYRADEANIFVIRIFDTRQNPSVQSDF